MADKKIRFMSMITPVISDELYMAVKQTGESMEKEIIACFFGPPC